MPASPVSRPATPHPDASNDFLRHRVADMQPSPYSRPPTPHTIAAFRDMLSGPAHAEQFLNSRMPETPIPTTAQQGECNAQRTQYLAMNDANPWPMLSEAFNTPTDAGKDQADSPKPEVEKRKERRTRCRGLSSITKRKITNHQPPLTDVPKSKPTPESSGTSFESNQDGAPNTPMNSSQESGRINMERSARTRYHYLRGMVREVVITEQMTRGAKYFQMLKGDDQADTSARLTYQSRFPDGTYQSRFTEGTSNIDPGSEPEDVDDSPECLPCFKLPRSCDPTTNNGKATGRFNRARQIQEHREYQPGYRVQGRSGAVAALHRYNADNAGLRITTHGDTQSQTPVQENSYSNAQNLRQACQAENGQRTKTRQKKRKNCSFWTHRRWWDLRNMTPIQEQEESPAKTMQELRDTHRHSVIARSMNGPDEVSLASSGTSNPVIRGRSLCSSTRTVENLTYNQRYGIPDWVVIRGASLGGSSVRSPEMQSAHDNHAEEEDHSQSENHSQVDNHSEGENLSQMDNHSQGENLSQRENSLQDESHSQLESHSEDATDDHILRVISGAPRIPSYTTNTPASSASASVYSIVEAQTQSIRPLQLSPQKRDELEFRRRSQLAETIRSDTPITSSNERPLSGLWPIQNFDFGFEWKDLDLEKEVESRRNSGTLWPADMGME